jgi:hypothetical protein
MAISCLRAAVRAASKLATFEQAIKSTRLATNITIASVFRNALKNRDGRPRETDRTDSGTLMNFAL